MVTTSKNPVSVSMPREGLARFPVSACSKTGAGVLIMKRQQHRLTNHVVYKKWDAIKQRCFNPNEVAFRDYGGRGITLCDEWVNDPKSFIEYVIDLPNAMEQGMSLDRINNDGDYEPGNLRWTDHHTQAANKRRRNSITGYTGVHPNAKGKKYYAVISLYYKKIYLGIHRTIEDAVNARNKYIIDNNLTEFKPQEYIG